MSEQADAKTFLLVVATALVGCELPLSPYTMFPIADKCPPVLSHHYPSFFEAMASVRRGGGCAVRRREWLHPAHGSLCVATGTSDFVTGYNGKTGEKGLFLFHSVDGRDVIETYVPTIEDMAADDWETV